MKYARLIALDDLNIKFYDLDPFNKSKIEDEIFYNPVQNYES